MATPGFWGSPHPGGARCLLALTLVLFAPLLRIEGPWTLIPMGLGIFTGIGAFAWLFMSGTSLYDYLSATPVAGRVGARSRWRWGPPSASTSCPRSWPLHRAAIAARGRRRRSS